MPIGDDREVREVTPEVSIVIPTYGRDRILCDTIESLLALPVRAREILVVDQTERHDAEAEAWLTEADRAGRIRWIRQSPPSIPKAMNRGLVDARHGIVLFLDDDILPDAELVSAHASAHDHGTPPSVVAGRVVQPWDKDEPSDGPGFSFSQTDEAEVPTFMEGNFSLPRRLAIDLGGFDESFVGAAYRFGAEFAHRLLRSGARIRFEPRASVDHLHASHGGTRHRGDHLRTWRPDHAVGEYYFLFRTRPSGWLGRMLMRPLRAVRTRHHLARPWWIPVTLVAETLGWGWAVWLSLHKPQTLAPGAVRGESGSR